MKKQITLLTISFFLSLGVFAQAPEKMSYQAVVRDISSGLPLGAQGVTVRFTIHESAANGTVVYQESQALNTNQFGLFTAEIGGGTVISGTFSIITWGSNSYYLQVEVDAGSGFDNLGASQLLSVPYALYSKESLNGPTGAQGIPGIGINWLGSFAANPSTPNLNDAYYNTTSGQSFVWDGSSWNIMAQDGTAGGFIGGAGIDITGNTISNTGDLDSLNELQVISKVGLNITLSNGGGTVTDSINDADADPNNERITTFALNGTSDSLVIVEAGVGHSFPLSNLNDGDWTKGTGNDIYNNIDSVGIGTTDPKSPLQLGNYMHLFSLNMNAGLDDYSVSTYNAHWDGTTIRNTTGGTSAISIMGHENGTAVHSTMLFPSQPVGGDIMAVNPFPKMTLKGNGLGINADNPEAALEVSSADSASIFMDQPDDGSQATLSYRSPGNEILSLRVPTTLTSGDYTLTYPAALPASNGSALVSDLSGNLSWASAPAAIWSQGTGTISPFTLTDNVGIGTSSPGAPLHVVGHIWQTIPGKSTFIGLAAGANDNQAANNQNTYVGYRSGNANVSGSNNTALGYNSLQTASTGGHNTSIGSGALGFTTGAYNTAIGSAAMFTNVAGGYNVSLGWNSGYDNTSGNNNIAIGALAGMVNTTGSNNIFIGYNAKPGVGYTNLSNAIAIGANATVDQSNSLILGNNANVGIGTSTPSAKLDVAGTFKLTDGSEGAGKVLTSDNAGNATWKTNQVAFFVGMGGSNDNGNLQSLTVGTGQTLDFDETLLEFYYNPNGDYSSTNNHFKAPVSGVYKIEASVQFAGAATGYFYYELMHSSGFGITSQEGFFDGVTQNRHTGVLAATVHLQAGEEIWIEYNNSNGAASFYRGNSTFSGHLIYED